MLDGRACDWSGVGVFAHGVTANDDRLGEAAVLRIGLHFLRLGQHPQRPDDADHQHWQ